MKLNVEFDEEALKKSVTDYFNAHLQAAMIAKANEYLSQFDKYLLDRVLNVVDNAIEEVKKEKIMEVMKERIKEIEINFDESGIVNQSIDDMEFSIRTRNALAFENINCLRDLITKSERELLRLDNIGRKALLEIREKLASLGLSLRLDNFNIIDNRKNYE